MLPRQAGRSKGHTKYLAPARCPPRASGVHSDLTPSFPRSSPPGTSTKHILDDISTMFDALANQLDAMLD